MKTEGFSPGKKQPRRDRSVKQPFRFRVLAYLVALMVLLTIVLSGLLIHVQREMLERHIVQEGSTLVQLLVDSVRLGVFAEDAEDLSRAVTSLTRHESVLQAVVFDASGRVLEGRTTRDSPTRGYDDGRMEVPEELKLDVRSASGDTVRVDGEGEIAFWRVVYDRPTYRSADDLYFEGLARPEERGSAIGFVAVTVSKAALRKGTRAIVVRSLAVGLMFLFFGMAISFLVVRDASKPLIQLAAEIRSQGITVETEDDLGVLSDTFSLLVDTLDQSFATINELKAGLERRVEARTAELAEANRELHDEIVERRRLMEELQKARDELEQRVEERTAELKATHQRLLQSEKLSAVGQLAASLAHEFNNPIFGVRNVLQDLKETIELNEDEAALVGMAIDECNRITNLIRGLQDFNRPTSGVARPMDVHESIDSMLTLCAKRFSVEKIRVEKQFGEGVPQIQAVEDQIKQVILNLLTNAADAMSGNGGTVRISTKSSNGTVEIGIEDTGSGIREESVSRIFDPFFTTKPAVKGTGLGLSVSYGIVKRHGGIIQVASKNGQGAAFTIRLPVKDVQDAEENPAC